MDRGAWWATVHGVTKRSNVRSMNQGKLEVVKQEMARVSHSLQPHGLYSSWNFPGQNTGVGRRFLLHVLANLKALL